MLLRTKRLSCIVVDLGLRQAECLYGLGLCRIKVKGFVNKAAGLMHI